MLSLKEDRFYNSPSTIAPGITKSLCKIATLAMLVYQVKVKPQYCEGHGTASNFYYLMSARRTM